MGTSSLIADVAERETAVVVSVKKPSRRYLDAFLRLKCASDLVRFRLFPNSKEITESMAARQALTSVLGMEGLGWPEVCALVPGDGSTPRTGALLAFTSRWRVVSVDPRFSAKWVSPGKASSEIRRLTALRGRVPSDIPPPLLRGKLHLLVAVHAHLDLTSWWRALPAPKVCVSIPCCQPRRQQLSDPPLRDYHDWGIWSPDRRVMIWREVS